MSGGSVRKAVAGAGLAATGVLFLAGEGLLTRVDTFAENLPAFLGPVFVLTSYGLAFLSVRISYYRGGDRDGVF